MVTKIDELGRAIQFACKIAHSIDYFQHPCKTSYSWRTTLLITKMSHPAGRSMATREYKRMKPKRSVWRPVNAPLHLGGSYVWRPVNTQSHLCEGKENEKIDCNIGNLVEETDHSSKLNAESVSSENDSGKISHISGAGNLEIQSVSQDDVEKNESVRCVRLSSIEKSVTEVHLESEASTDATTTNQDSLVVTTNLEDSIKGEQQGGDTKEDTETVESCTTAQESVETTTHSVTVKVDTPLLRFVKGKGGKVLKKIEETGVKISIISAKEGSSVVVDGPSNESVTAAAKKIQQILDEAVKSPNLQYSHFISLPLAVHPALVEKLTNFQKSILELISRFEKEEKDLEGASNEEFSAEDSCEDLEEGAEVAVKLNVEDDSEHVKVDIVQMPAENAFSDIPRTFSQEKDCENSDERRDVAVKLNVEDDNVSVKLDVAEIAAGDMRVKHKRLISQENSGENSDEREDVAVKLNVEDDHVSVKLDAAETPAGDVHVKSKRLPSDAAVGENSEKRADVLVKLHVEDDNVRVKLDVAEIPVGDVPVKSARLLSGGKKNLGIDKSIFNKPETFHLTVLMLKLWNNERIAAAAETLQKISPQVKDALEGRSLAVSLKGLKCMKGKASRAHVLYAPVEEVGSGGCLLRACQVIIDAFVEADLVIEKDARQPLKLHATVMNATHRKQKKRYRRPLHFDARPILELYGSEDWGEYVIPEVHLSQRFSYDENGYYHCCASIPFPEIAQEADIQ